MIVRLGWFELIRLHVLITTGVDVHVVPTISGFPDSSNLHPIRVHLCLLDVLTFLFSTVCTINYNVCHYG